MDEYTQDQIKKLFAKHRKAVRREYFKRQGALKRLLRAAGAGDPGPALKPGSDIAGSSGVARPPLQGNEVTALTGSPSAAPLPESILTISSRKAMPERDDEKMGRID